MSETRRSWLIDATIAAGVAALLSLQALAPFEQEARDPDWQAFALMILIGATLLFRRRFPIGILVVSALLLMLYYTLGYGAVGVVWPLAAGLFSASLYGRWRDATLIGGTVLVVGSMWRLVIEPSIAQPEGSLPGTLSDILSEISFGVALILAGAMIRNRRQLREAFHARAAALAAEREAESRRQLTEQRLHIAREVHDVVAHALAGIGVQAHLAEEVVESDVDEAKSSIRTIIDTTNAAVKQLRETVGGLRDAPGALPTAAPALDELVAGVTGVEVDLRTNGDLGSLPSDVGNTIRAVVREALTNTVRHSGATQATVHVVHNDDLVTVTVTDNGGGGDPVAGSGIRGMRERVHSVGGSLETGPADAGGFQVKATIPL